MQSKFKIGDRVRRVRKCGGWDFGYLGEEGTVTGVNNTGNIHVRFDNGRDSINAGSEGRFELVTPTPPTHVVNDILTSNVEGAVEVAFKTSDTVTISKLVLVETRKKVIVVETASEVAPKSKRGYNEYGVEVICQPHMTFNTWSSGTDSRRALRNPDGFWALYGGGVYQVDNEAQAIAWVEDGILP